MRVSVTGATGALGLASVGMLLRAGHQVRAFVRRSEAFRARCVDERVEVVEGDILDRAAVAAALEGAEAVLHCVRFPPRRFLMYWDATRHVLEGLRGGGGGGQFVMPGNLWVYGPSDVERIGPDHARWSPARLGALSADLEKAVSAEGVTVIRLPEVYGPGVRRGWLGKAFERALAGTAVWFPGDLDRPVEYLYVEDAARALLAPLGRRASRGREYTAPGHTVTTPREFASLIFQAVGKEGRLRSLPLGWLRGRALLGPNGWAQRGLTHLYASAILLDGTRIREELAWTPEVDYPEGVRRTVRSRAAG